MRKAPGDRVKTDRRDAAYLARLLMVGDYVECTPPTPEMEAARDLSRIREDAREDLMAARHQLSKMLLRYGELQSFGGQRDGRNLQPVCSGGMPSHRHQQIGAERCQ